MGEKKFHHHWKIWLSIILIVGIVGLLFYTNTLNFIKIGKFISTVSPPLKNFPIKFVAGEETFYSQSYMISNTSFTADGICQKTVKINDITLNRDGVICKVALDGLTGSFDFTQGGSVVVSGYVTSMKLDESLYSSGKSMKVTIQIVPTTFLLSDLSQKIITFSSATGNISKLKGDGASVIGFLDKSKLDINNFVGYINLESGQVILMGEASSVKSQEFNW